MDACAGRRRNRSPKVLDATGASMEQFLGFMRSVDGASGTSDRAFPPPASSIPLLGFAQAGAGGFFDDGGFPVGQGWDMVEFPVAPGQRGGVYALEVQGESMLPLYRDGDVLIVEPGAQIRRNDRVVVKTREGEVMAKVLLQTERSVDRTAVAQPGTSEPQLRPYGCGMGCTDHLGQPIGKFSRYAS